ncbi:hypothetical protein J4212_07435 [Candidatus Woesearchaeota archaeon]|nr:hypothetical protein [Candidatus Woesearchaeota archaeon]
MDLKESQRNVHIAQALQKSGLASSLNEASSKASMIISSSEGKQQDEEIRLLEVKYKFLLEQQSERHNSAVSQLKGVVEGLQSQLSFMKAEIESVKAQKQNPPNVNRGKEVQQSQRQDGEQGQNAAKEPHHANGRFTSDDVSVDKFFYFGKK